MVTVLSRTGGISDSAGSPSIGYRRRESMGTLCFLLFAQISPGTPHTCRPPLADGARTGYEENNDIGKITPEGLVMQSDISEQQVDCFRDVEPAFERPGMRSGIVDWSFT